MGWKRLLTDVKQECCVSYDFRELFYTDYYGVKWSGNGKNTTIHWMAISNQMNIPGENYGPVQVIPVSNEV